MGRGDEMRRRHSNFLRWTRLQRKLAQYFVIICNRFSRLVALRMLLFVYELYPSVRKIFCKQLAECSVVAF